MANGKSGHVRLTLLLVTHLSALLSIGAKFLADAYLTKRMAIVGSFIGLTPSYNPGVAFGITLPSAIQTLVIVLAFLVVFVLGWRTSRTPLSAIGFGLILGGAVANILDRLQDGLVTDFFQIGTFPIFNVADSCITIGVVTLLVEMLQKRMRT